MKRAEISRKKEKGVKTKRKVFESAALLFGQYDFDEVSVDNIVETAGVAKGTFYIYFDSKDALIASFLSDYVGRVDMDYKNHLDSLPDGTTSSDMLLSLISKIADVLADTIGYNRMRIVYKVQLTKSINMDTVQGYNRELYHIFTDIFRRGIERGEFKTELSIDLLAKHFVMAIRGLSFEWCIRYPDFDLKEQALVHFHILLDGIKSNGQENFFPSI